MVVRCYNITLSVTYLQSLYANLQTIDRGDERHSLNTFSILDHPHLPLHMRVYKVGLQRGLGFFTVTQMLAAGSLCM